MVNTTNATMTISNSEVVSYQTCPRKHFYSHVLELQPIVASLALERGNTGHGALKLYYEAMIKGEKKEDCVQVAAEHIFVRASNQIADMANGNMDVEDQNDRIKMYGELATLIETYADYYWGRSYVPLEVEKAHIIKINDRLNLGLRIDLLAESINPTTKGDIEVVDWKFRYNFPKPKVLGLNGQLPKYIWAMRKEGQSVSKGKLDILRYRGLKSPELTNVFRREPIEPNACAREMIMEDHIRTSEEIYQKKLLPVAEYRKEATRTLSELSCNFCPFTDICTLELRGQDPTLTIATKYKPSEYGYDLNIQDEVLVF